MWAVTSDEELRTVVAEARAFKDSLLWRVLRARAEFLLGADRGLLEDHKSSLDDIRFSQGRVAGTKRAIMLVDDLLAYAARDLRKGERK